eukprot:SAG11_NODE_33437_length_277_cov_0.865169_1_plen_47_part_01
MRSSAVPLSGIGIGFYSNVKEALPEVEETSTPFGLTPEQHAKLKELW